MEETIILSSVAEGIIASLGSLPVKQIVQSWGVEDELEKLKDTVSTIKVLLLGAEEQQDGNLEIRVWLEKLKNPMYDADDLLDDVSSEARPQEMETRDKMTKKKLNVFSESNQVRQSPYHIGKKIKGIRERLDAIVADRKFYLEGYRVKKAIENKKRGDTYSFVLKNDVIGREEDKEAVIALLLDSDVEKELSILPIVGIGGLGKTVLAKLVFNDDRVQQHFNLKMWVCVSDIFDVKILVKNILESATGNKQEDVAMDVLTRSLKKLILGKKYFLVLDDVWNENSEKWSSFKPLLMGCACGSRVLLTTRSKMVAEITKTSKPYPLEGLGEEDSWHLFIKMAFGEEKELPENVSIFEAIRKEIVAKCVGVPLAIRTIGGLMYFKDPETEWLSFMTTELSRISQNENDIMPILKLSYNKLPSHLKQCFAYCSLFPKDHIFEKSVLIYLWMAQGFISVSNQHQELEDIGHDYFMHLLWRSFFQDAEVDELGNIISCKMHDLMHDLATLVAGSFITTLDSIDEKTRHVSIDSFSVVTTSLSTSTRIRTLCLLDTSLDVTESTCDTIFSSIQFLRALDLNDLELDSVANFICKLKHLRYLDLFCNIRIIKLPDSITSLQNLQTLRLSFCWRLEELPGDIKKLVNLRHLEIGECHSLKYMPRGLGELTNLQTLSQFVIPSGSVSTDYGDLSELDSLNSLRGKLVISIQRCVQDSASQSKAANLKEKKNLHALCLSWIYESDGSDSSGDVLFEELKGFQPHPNLKSLSILEYRGMVFPNWLCSLTNLVRLKLEYCNKLQYLPSWSQLPSIKYVSLNELPSLEYISDISDSSDFSSSGLAPFFPSLEEISLRNCPSLKGWWWRREPSVRITSDDDESVEMNTETLVITPHLLLSFPRLSTMSISGFPMLTTHIASPTPLSKLKHLTLCNIGDLETLPKEWLQNLTSLESLRISCCDALDVCNVEVGTQWQYLKSLLSLEFDRLPMLVSLPLWLQHVSNLQKLSINFCDSFMTIPEWIDNCTSLLHLEIRVCSSLTSLPEGMRRLSLQRLEIWGGSSILLNRCNRQTGVDWDKISNISQLYIN